MEIRLLGPVEMWLGGRRLDAGPPQQRAVLAALAVNAGQFVSTDTLIDRVWGENPPLRARSALHANISRIRGVLRGSAATRTDHTWTELALQPGGYVLRADPSRVDLQRFRDLVIRGRRPYVSDSERASLFRQALEMWQGPGLADLPGDWPARVREGWRLEYVDSAVDWALAELSIGGHSRVIGPLREIMVDHPMAERLAVVLMRALMAAGHTAEALNCYAATRAVLVGRLGVEPGAELRAAHQTILRGTSDVRHDVRWPSLRFVENEESLVCRRARSA